MAEKEYIERDKAKWAIMDYIGEQTVSKYASSAECKAARFGAEGAMYAVEDVPAADVVEVVRCKDCKSNPNIGTLTKGMLWCRKFRAEVHPNDFCSYGERKEQK